MNKPNVSQFIDIINESHHVVALTGAGISTASGIPDLEHLTGPESNIISSENALEEDPEKFFQATKKLFLDNIFNNGPTTAHKVLAALETARKLEGVITTNVDYLHEIAGSNNVADVWSSFNVNYCLRCHKTYPISVWKQGHAPMCPDDGGIISPSPTFNHIARSPVDLEQAGEMMEKADLVIVIGSNGYYSNLNSTTKVVQINPKRTGFDLRANINFHDSADKILQQVAQQMNLNY